MIGVEYDDKYAAQEVFQLLKVPWEWYTPTSTYDVVISKNSHLPGARNVIDLADNDLIKKIADTLNEGVPRNRKPICDECLDALRQEIKHFSPLIEIPPIPWGYNYSLALTHDVDTTSVRERSIPSVLYAAYNCFRQRRFIEGARIVLAKLGLAEDPWDLFETWRELEEKHQVKSTFYFLPRSGHAGIGSPKIRAGYYSIDDVPIKKLTAGGWEVGIHGIDNWIDRISADTERMALPRDARVKVGTRVHWLHFDEGTWQILDDAGYEYDSTFGYNEDVGFRAGTLQVYQPRGVERLLELPLHIQDVSLFGRHCWLTTEKGCERVDCLSLDESEAYRTCNEILDQAMQYGGVVTILWHSDCLAAPRDWGNVYTSIINRAKSDNAWITRAIDIVDWFRMRRGVRLDYSKTKDRLRITVAGLETARSLPPLRLRVHIDPAQVRYIDAEYVCGDGYVDIRCDREHVDVVLA
ncbi:polysaccharide deacetylase family protein [Methanoculleus sp. 7T]|uniref:polysaccharide deacetylase family protein n=1 Tax=Methanoculleus sp. 7T TaxID=2937282 RepID=UPI0020C0875D|nr:polysaccharide deacetylase family protein [Methanoculleus sp. 7T]MCK8519394.1 polysaccharide deacetylase family protein [Methanoculleus sp. 7T]